MRHKFIALASTLFALLSIASSEASAMTYDLVLSGTSGQLDGTFTVNGSVPNSGQSGPLHITALSLSVSGNSYNFTSELFTPIATFTNGGLTSIEYAGAADGFKLDLGTFGLGYMFIDSVNPGLSSLGTVSASATPLPPSWTLMLLGLAAFGFIAYRRNRTFGTMSSLSQSANLAPA